MVPPVLTQWHVEPANPRHFDIALAKQKLEDAGYPLNASGQRLDKAGNPISLRLMMPDSSENHPKAAQFIADWYGQLGIKVTTSVLDSATLGEIILPPEAGDGYKADYDIELWGWIGNIDPNGLTSVFKCDAIGSSSDSQYCNPAYDKLYNEQNLAETPEARHAILEQMQNIIYDDAPYDILYYDSYLDAYRTDRFAGWQNQPANGIPLFTYSTLGYTKLTSAAAVASAEPSAAATSGGTAPSAVATATGGEPSAAGSNTTMIIAIVAAVAVLAVGLLYLARRRGAARAEEE
jgi:peptide/nickel transport system substrate-binding protein